MHSPVPSCCLYVYAVVESIFQIENLKSKLALTEENCQRVLARIGVATDESRVGVGTRPAKATVGKPSLTFGHWRAKASSYAWR